MSLRFLRLSSAAMFSLAIAVSSVAAQPPQRDRPDGDRPQRGERDGDRPQRGSRDGDRPHRGPGDRGPDVAPEAMAKQLMERFDKDGDKKLDATELVAALTEMRNHRGRPQGGPQQGQRGPREGANPEAMVQRIFEQNDKDGDGKLAGDEIPERMQQNIERIDTNSDGAIDKAEAGAVFSRMRGGRPGGDRPREDGDRPRPEGDRPRRPAAE